MIHFDDDGDGDYYLNCQQIKLSKGQRGRDDGRCCCLVYVAGVHKHQVARTHTHTHARTHTHMHTRTYFPPRRPCRRVRRPLVGAPASRIPGPPRIQGPLLLRYRIQDPAARWWTTTALRCGAGPGGVAWAVRWRGPWPSPWPCAPSCSWSCGGAGCCHVSHGLSTVLGRVGCCHVSHDLRVC